MTIIDTSLWVHQLRRQGDVDKRRRVEALLLDGEAAWCAPVRLELWRGVRSDKGAAVLSEYEGILHEFEVGEATWQLACELSYRCRSSGKTAPFADLLIAACARQYGVEVAHADGHFDFLMVL